MEQVGAQNTLALEPDLLSNPLRSAVVRVGDQLEPLESEIFERVLAEKPKCSSRYTTASRVGGAPIADVAGARIVHAHSDRSDDTSPLGNGELLAPDSRNLPLDERARVFLRVGTRDDRNPVLNLGVVAGVDDRRNIVQSPRAKLQVAVA